MECLSVGDNARFAILLLAAVCADRKPNRKVGAEMRVSAAKNLSNGSIAKVLFVSAIAGMCGACSKLPPRPMKVASSEPAEVVSAEHTVALASDPPAKSEAEIQAAWLEDTFRETAGMILHREPYPKTMKIGGNVWSRTNERAKLYKSLPYVKQVIYLCPNDPDRRLALFFDADPPGYPDPAIYLLLDEQRIIDGTWENDGHSVSLRGQPRKFHCKRLSRGRPKTYLTTHYIGDNGKLVPTSMPVISERSWTRGPNNEKIYEE